MLNCLGRRQRRQPARRFGQRPRSTVDQPIFDLARVGVARGRPRTSPSMSFPRRFSPSSAMTSPRRSATSTPPAPQRIRSFRYGSRYHRAPADRRTPNGLLRSSSASPCRDEGRRRGRHAGLVDQSLHSFLKVIPEPGLCRGSAGCLQQQLDEAEARRRAVIRSSFPASASRSELSSFTLRSSGACAASRTGATSRKRPESRFHPETCR